MTFQLYRDIRTDIEAHGFQNPPFSTVLHMVIFHPSIRMLLNYRLQQKISGKDALSRLLKRYLWFRNCRQSSCHISPEAIIEPGVRFPHATGIVIGPHVHVKSGAIIFQNVTLGMIENISNTSPTIEQGATVFSGSVIVGNYIIKRNAVIGANSVVKSDIAEESVVAGAPARPLHS